MPRKTPPARRSWGTAPPRFNEAAARCRGKLDVHGRTATPLRGASMRPRPDAAENSTCCGTSACVRRCFNEAAARCRGKLGGRVRPAGSRNAASMRPRPDAAENFKTEYRLDAAIPASMRPRPDAAENYGCQRQPRPRTPRFNEAAARCRGKPRTGDRRRSRASRASMRPRPDAAENR